MLHKHTHTTLLFKVDSQHFSMLEVQNKHLVPWHTEVPKGWGWWQMQEWSHKIIKVLQKRLRFYETKPLSFCFTAAEFTSFSTREAGDTASFESLCAFSWSSFKKVAVCFLSKSFLLALALPPFIFSNSYFQECLLHTPPAASSSSNQSKEPHPADHTVSQTTHWPIKDCSFKFLKHAFKVQETQKQHRHAGWVTWNVCRTTHASFTVTQRKKAKFFRLMVIKVKIPPTFSDQPNSPTISGFPGGRQSVVQPH